MSELLAMGGYGAYVWPAYALTAIVMVGLLYFAWQGLRQRQQELARLEAELPNRRRHRAGGNREG